jgi:TRAP-type C4-dicarboxylate transport system substrate-binding protein
VSFYTPVLHPFSRVIGEWVKEVETASGGKVKFTLSHPTHLEDADKKYDMVASGAADIAVCGLAAYPGRFPLTELCSLPYLFSSDRQATLVVAELMQENVRAEFPDVELLSSFCFTEYDIYTAKKQVKALADLKGLKIAVSGDIPAETIKALGAVPTTVWLSDRYTALEQKQVDGVHWLAESIVVFNVHLVLKYAAISNNTWAHVFFVIMNPQSWQKLPAEVKDIMEKTGREKLGLHVIDEFIKVERNARKVMRESGTVFFKLPSREKAKWMEVTSRVALNWMQRLEAQNLPSHQTYDVIVRLIRKYADA